MDATLQPARRIIARLLIADAGFFREFHYLDPLRVDPLIRLKRIYNFLCSMLVFTPFALCFVTLHGVFMRFPELTY
jgi:hypothetical protein